MIPELGLAEIQQRGYREDRQALGAFERRYRWATGPAIAVVVGAVYLLATGRLIPGFMLFVAGLAFCFGAAYHAACATPLSRISGRPMQRYRRSDCPREQTEIIYVDDANRSYFVRLISRPSSIIP